MARQDLACLFGNGIRACSATAARADSSAPVPFPSTETRSNPAQAAGCFCICADCTFLEMIPHHAWPGRTWLVSLAMAYVHAQLPLLMLIPQHPCHSPARKPAATLPRQPAASVSVLIARLCTGPLTDACKVTQYTCPQNRTLVSTVCRGVSLCIPMATAVARQLCTVYCLTSIIWGCPPPLPPRPPGISAHMTTRMAAHASADCRAVCSAPASQWQACSANPSPPVPCSTGPKPTCASRLVSPLWWKRYQFLQLSDHKDLQA